MSKQNVDLLIVGQGIAGSTLGYALKKAGFSVAILDNKLRESSTKVAAGLVSYISGKRLTLSWRAHDLIPTALQFYQDLEKELATSFYTPLPSLRIFTTEDEKKTFEKKRNLPEYQVHYGKAYDNGKHVNINAPFGAVEVKGSCFLDTVSFLSAMSDFLKDEIHHTTVNWKDIEVFDDGIQYHDFSAQKLICCSGYNVTKTPWFSSLPYRPARGQTLTMEVPELPKDKIYNFGRWMVPLKNGRFKFGATYEWDDMDLEITEDSKQELLTHFRRHFDVTPTVIKQEVGVRCMVQDNHPFLGFLNATPSVGVFSGFGSKGVMMVPYFAEQMVRHLKDATAIDADVSLERFGL
jgi:glycine/D-amino acid oxidase-like deaminating enzyme